MDFELSDDQRALREAVARWAAQAHPFERRQALVKAGGHSRAVWQELCDLGLSGLWIEAEWGGSALGPVEAMVVAEELGRHLVTAPWVEAAMVAPTLMRHASPAFQHRWMPQVASGACLAVWCAPPWKASMPPSRSVARLLDAEGATGTHWRLDSTVVGVPAGDEADAWIVPALMPERGEWGLFWVEASAEGVQRTGRVHHDGTRSAQLQLTDTPAVCLCAGQEASDAMQDASDVGLAMACAEAVGLMDDMLDTTVDYLKTRRQFGQALSQFQALRHQAANLKMALELARSMAYAAVLSLPQDRQARRKLMSQAKWQVNQSLRAVGQGCVQLHGGMGLTDECRISHGFKRATALAMAWGDSQHHLAEMASRLDQRVGVAG